MVLIVEEAEPVSSDEEELELVRETEAAEETARDTETATSETKTTTKPSDIAALGLTQEETGLVL